MSGFKLNDRMHDIVVAKKAHKFHATKTEFLGIVFDSKREAARYSALLIRGLAGEIADLELQPMFPIVVNGVKVCVYRGDFKYYDHVSGQWTVEDVKGMDLPLGRLKRRLVAAQYGVQVAVVK